MDVGSIELTCESRPHDSVQRPVIRVRGARTHNLQSIDLDIPRGRLVVVTGVSGSGKTSLVFDTLAAEGQRLFLECAAPDWGPFLDRLPAPRVDRIEGLPPTVAIDQKTAAPSPRSTLGTLTEINNYLRLLFARFATPHCPSCGHAIERHAPEQIVARLLELEAGRKIQILAPLVRNRAGGYAQALAAIRQAGLLRARVDGQNVEIAELSEQLDESGTHAVEAVVDRIVVREGVRQRVADSVALALGLSGGQVLALVEGGGGWEERLFTVSLACPVCGTGLEELEPRSYSFNSPRGACAVCQGLGVSGPGMRGIQSGGEPVVCEACGGARLAPGPLAARFAGRTIADLWAMECGELETLLAEAPADPAARGLIEQICSRLETCRALGLGHLALGRSSTTLSGGELKRARLAGQLGDGLSQACYLLDEPTTGLHPQDIAALLDRLRSLVARGNSVIVVDHDRSLIKAASPVIEIGPGAGPEGGRVVAVGAPGDLVHMPGSVTGPYLAGIQAVGGRSAGREPGSRGWIRVEGARVHNLREIEARFPRGCLSVVSGVSGSGKSSLVHDVLAREARRFLVGEPPGSGVGRVSGLESLTRVIEADQGPIGRGPRSFPVSMVGSLAAIRRVFAGTREARARGMTADYFSLNIKGGRCENCRGLGVERSGSRLLPELEVVCRVCEGLRYQARALEPRFKGLSIADVLALRVDESLRVFGSIPRVVRGLASLAEAGLGYLILGQSSLTLSGGEAQRVKLAAELARGTSGSTLYLLDEPTSGLHPADVSRLLETLAKLTDAGDTVIVIEHDPAVIAAADWVVDLGPGGGKHGGQVVAMGDPAAIARDPLSLTGQSLLAAGFLTD